MIRDACLQALASHYRGEIVVSVYTTCFEWLAIRPDALNYVSVGAMGQACSHGLGLALGRPDKRVLVLDGDGSLLMNLGALVTIGGAAPRNLSHFVFQNGTYEANGGHPLPGPSPLEFRDIARAAGYRETYMFDRQEAFRDALPELLRAPGPVFADLRVAPSRHGYPQDYPYLHSAEARRRFREALANDAWARAGLS